MDYAYEAFVHEICMEEENKESMLNNFKTKVKNIITKFINFCKIICAKVANAITSLHARITAKMAQSKAEKLGKKAGTAKVKAMEADQSQASTALAVRNQNTAVSNYDYGNSTTAKFTENGIIIPDQWAPRGAAAVVKMKELMAGITRAYWTKMQQISSGKVSEDNPVDANNSKDMTFDQFIKKVEDTLQDKKTNIMAYNAMGIVNNKVFNFAKYINIAKKYRQDVAEANREIQNVSNKHEALVEHNAENVSLNTQFAMESAMIKYSTEVIKVSTYFFTDINRIMGDKIEWTSDVKEENKPVPVK